MTNNIPFEFIPQNVTFEQMNAIIHFGTFGWSYACGCEVCPQLHRRPSSIEMPYQTAYTWECPLNFTTPLSFLRQSNCGGINQNIRLILILEAGGCEKG